MKFKSRIFLGVIVIIVLHTIVFGYSLATLATPGDLPIFAIVGFALVVLISLLIGYLIAKRNAKNVTLIADRIASLTNDPITASSDDNVKSNNVATIYTLLDQTEDRFHEMEKFISTFTDHMNKQTNVLKENVDGLAENSSHITNTMQEISSGAEEQANSAASLTETMQQFTNTIMTVAMNGENIKEDSKSMLSITDEGSKLMNQSIEKMTIIDDTIKQSLDKVKGLDDMTLKITQLVVVIQEVAEQTNLLALNAAIEAARAGEHGKGFAVVADEVRKLAEQVSLSINDITTTTNGIQEESKSAVEVLEKGYQAVNEGSEQIQTTGTTLNKVTDIINNMSDEIQGISSSLYDVLDNTKSINDTITNVASVSEESAAGIAEAESASERLTSAINKIRQGQDDFEQEIAKLFM